MMDDLREFFDEFMELDMPRQCAVGENWFVPVKDDMFLQLISGLKIGYGPDCKEEDKEDWFYENEWTAFLACALYYEKHNAPFPYPEELLKILEAFPLKLEDDEDDT